jgi:hypothetical protein
MARAVVFEQNERLLERGRELPRRVQDEVWAHLPHYLHSVLRISWLADSTAGVSALLSSSWRKQPMSLSLQEPAGLLGLDPAVVAPLSTNGSPPAPGNRSRTIRSFLIRRVAAPFLSLGSSASQVVYGLR